MKYFSSIDGIPGTTTRVAASDAVQQLAAAITDNNNSPANKIIISCEDNAVRYAFNTDPTQGADPVGHILYPTQTLELSNGRTVREFRFINETNGSDGFLQVTGLFKIGAS